jgi:hypothetical protein
LIFSSTVISPTSALTGIVWKTSSSLCSSFFACCFLSSCSIWIYFRTISRKSFSSLVVSKFVVYVLALDCTSYATMIFNLYSDLFGILDNTNSICSTSLTCLCSMYSSICNMSLVILKFLFVSFFICTITYSLHVGLSCSYTIGYCYVSPLCCIWVNYIYSKTFLTFVNSCIIFSLCLSAYSYVSSMQSCAFSMTNYVSSFVIVYWGISLCAFIFLCTPLAYKIVLSSGLDSFFSVVIGVLISGMSPPTCPSYTGMLYSLCVPPLVASMWFF